jgi:hypothetical protein
MRQDNFSEGVDCYIRLYRREPRIGIPTPNSELRAFNLCLDLGIWLFKIKTLYFKIMLAPLFRFVGILPPRSKGTVLAFVCPVIRFAA